MLPLETVVITKIALYLCNGTDAEFNSCVRGTKFSTSEFFASQNCISMDVLLLLFTSDNIRIEFITLKHL